MEALIPDTLKARFKFGSTVVQCWLNVGIDAACVGPTWLPISVIPTGMLADSSAGVSTLRKNAKQQLTSRDSNKPGIFNWLHRWCLQALGRVFMTILSALQTPRNLRTSDVHWMP